MIIKEKRIIVDKMNEQDKGGYYLHKNVEKGKSVSRIFHIYLTDYDL